MRTPCVTARYSGLGMGIDRARMARGALAGAAAAGAWAAQQPLDQRVFGCGYDDVALLGKAVTRGPHWYPVGLALHMGNGAAFGAVFAGLAPRVPAPRTAVAIGAGMLENFALWPLGRLTDRHHPARDELARLTGNRRALAQATWRHLLFSILLGELERRLNPPTAPVEEHGYVVSSNGHGNLEHAVAAASVAGEAGSAS